MGTNLKGLKNRSGTRLAERFRFTLHVSLSPRKRQALVIMTGLGPAFYRIPVTQK